MIDYAALGLDQNLRPINSPATTYGDGDINSMVYDSTLDRSAVTTTKIANLAVTNAKIVNVDADKIAAGTIVVGVNVPAANVTAGTFAGSVNLPAANVLAGTLATALNVGTAATGYVLLDGPNNRIVVNDGTTNRIVIGNI